MRFRLLGSGEGTPFILSGSGLSGFRFSLGMFLALKFLNGFWVPEMQESWADLLQFGVVALAFDRRRVAERMHGLAWVWPTRLCSSG